MIAGFIIAAAAMMESALLTKTKGVALTKAKIVAEAKALFQPLQAKDVVTHRLVREALGGSSPTPAAECALLTAKNFLAISNQLFELLQVENVVTQLLFQAAVGGIGFIAVAMNVCREFFFFKPAPLKFTAHLDEPVERKVATLNFEKSRPGCEKHRLGLEKLVFRFLQIKIKREEIG
jgi:hypothetical protein